MKLRSPAGLAGLALALVLAAPAAAAPVSVNLRIEGPSSTLFEGPVTTDVRPLQFTGDPTAHQCDAGSAVPTRGAAITAASAAAPFSMLGTWHAMFGATFTHIAGVPVGWDGSRYLVEYKNWAATTVGACADPIQNGDDVLFAFAAGTEPLLRLSGPAKASPGSPVTVRVTNAGTQIPVPGATVAGAVTGADGTATVGPFATRGNTDLKATKAGAIRSNRLRVCVSDGADGHCGTVVPDTTAPTATIAGIRNGQRFSRKRAPRELKGTVSADPSGLWAVKLRLTRKLGKTCWYFSGTKERLLERTCGKRYAFKVGDREEWSYLLPSRLRRGRYVLEAYGIDNAFNKGTPRRVAFRVR